MSNHSTNETVVKSLGLPVPGTPNGEVWWANIWNGPGAIAGKKHPEIRMIPGTKNILVGYEGKEGCFSARVIGDVVDVALYPETPEWVLDFMATHGSPDAAYRDVEDVPGWGYTASKHVKEIMSWVQ